MISHLAPRIGRGLPIRARLQDLIIFLWEKSGVTDERGWARLLRGFRVPADGVWRPTSRSTFLFAISFPHCLAQSTGPDPTRKVRRGKRKSGRTRAIGSLRRLPRTGGPVHVAPPATTQTALRPPRPAENGFRGSSLPQDNSNLNTPGTEPARRIGACCRRLAALSAGVGACNICLLKHIHACGSSAVCDILVRGGVPPS